MKAEDLKTKTEDELKKLLADNAKAQMNLRFQRSGGQLEKTHEIKILRRGAARLKTFLAMKTAKPGVAAAKAPAAPAKTKKTPAAKKTKAA